MTVTMTRWDSAKYLKTDEDIQLYLEACLEEAGDDRARNMNQLARDTGLTREDLSKALSSEGNPSFSTVAKVAKALGFKLTIRPLA